MCGRACFIGVGQLRLHTQQCLNDHISDCDLQLPDVVLRLLQILIDVLKGPLELLLILCGKFLAVLIYGIVRKVNEQILAATRRRRDIFFCGKAAQAVSVHKCY